MSAQVIVQPRGAQRVLQGHPWIFRSDILESGPAKPGEIVEVFKASRDRPQFLGQAFYNPQSQISLRIITRGRDLIDAKFWEKRFLEAIQRRKKTGRLVFGESDLLPGLIVDRYNDVVVFQILTLGMELSRETWIRLFQEILQPQAIVERNDPVVREKEGLPRQKGICWGGLPAPLEIEEGGFLHLVDPLEGQKTGLYLDQAENRIAIRPYIRGRVLDLFCYQGGFALSISKQAEEIIAVDSSGPALQIATKNLERNQVQNVQWVEANVFDYLRQCYEKGEKFDAILLDPPPFVSGRKDLSKGEKGYKEINLRAMKLLKPEGILVTSCCSQNFTEALFYSMLLEAARDTRRLVQVVEKRGAASDHPVLLSFPESFYLQCWILRIL